MPLKIKGIRLLQCTESGHADTEPAYLCSKITPQSAAGLAMILYILNDVGTHRAFNFSVGFGGKQEKNDVF